VKLKLGCVLQAEVRGYCVRPRLKGVDPDHFMKEGILSLTEIIGLASVRLGGKTKNLLWAMVLQLRFEQPVPAKKTGSLKRAGSKLTVFRY